MKKYYTKNYFRKNWCREVQEMPVAYLPLGTLEWHGPHMPLGADGIQSKGLFVCQVAKRSAVYFRAVYGPDRIFHDGEKHFMEWISIRRVHCTPIVSSS